MLESKLTSVDNESSVTLAPLHFSCFGPWCNLLGSKRMFSLNIEPLILWISLVVDLLGNPLEVTLLRPKAKSLQHGI